MKCQSKVRWRFCKILWPSQNIWTLIKISKPAGTRGDVQNFGGYQAPALTQALWFDFNKVSMNCASCVFWCWVSISKRLKFTNCIDWFRVWISKRFLWMVRIELCKLYPLMLFELQRIVQIVYWCCFVWISNRFQWIVRVVSIDVVFGLKLGWIVGSPNCAGKLYPLMSCLDFKRVSIRKSYY